jgi:hypothetical protein
MKKFSPFLVAAAVIVSGSAFAADATQTVTTNVAGALSISLASAADGTGAATIDTVVSDTTAGNSNSADVFLKIKSSDSAGFNVTALTDNAGGKMCEWDAGATTPAYTSNCLTNALQITSSAESGFTGTPTVVSTAKDLSDATAVKVVASTEQVTDATVKATVSQTMDWADKVLASNKYQVKVTYTINSGI